MFCNKNNISRYDFDGLRETVRGLIKEKRFNHILGVEQEAVKIAGIYECGEEFINKLRTAAILHDITKEFSYSQQLEICREYKIRLSKDDKKAEKPIHAKTAAYIAKIEFGADDIIFDGIYNHTISEPLKSFDLFNRIINLADWIEPNRIHEDCVAVREYFYSKIKNAGNIEQKHKVMDETILFSYNISIKVLLEDNLFIHKDTIKCRNALINKKVLV